mgnify:CR=1 FL=1
MLSNTVVSTTYEGDGSTTSFAVQFDLLANSQVKVSRYDSSTLVDEILTLGVEYTLTGSPATAVVFSVAPTSNQEITVYRETAKTQTVDYDDTASFPAAAHELALDKIVMMIQELGNSIDNISVTIPTGSGAFVRLADEAIAASGTISVSTNQRMLKTIEGDGGATTADTTTPIEAGTTDGQELRLVGGSDTDTVTVPNGGNAVLNGDMTFTLNSVLDLYWDDGQTKWVETGRKE